MYRSFSRLKIKPRSTQRLLLRGFEETDLEHYAKVLGHPTVSQWLGRPEGITQADTKQWIDGFSFWWEKHGYGPWAVIERSSNRIIGHCGLKFAEQFGATELMYAIHPDFQGKSYATEAGKLALEFGFKELNLSRIIAFTLPENKASRRVMEKLGMRYVKNIVHAKLDHVLYESLAVF